MCKYPFMSGSFTLCPHSPFFNKSVFRKPSLAKSKERRVAFLTWYFTLEILKETKMQRSVGSVSCTTYVAAAAAAKLLQLCLTLCDPTDGSLF